MVTMSSLAIVVGAGILLLGEKEVPIVARNAGRLAGRAMRLIRAGRSTVDTLTSSPGLNDVRLCAELARNGHRFRAKRTDVPMSAMAAMRAFPSPLSPLRSQVTKDFKVSMSELNRVRSDFREGLAPRASAFVSSPDLRATADGGRSPAAAVAARRAAGGRQASTQQGAPVAEARDGEVRGAPEGAMRDVDGGLRHAASLADAARGDTGGASPSVPTATTGSSLTGGIHRARRRK